MFMKANILIKNCLLFGLLPLTVSAFLLAGKYPQTVENIYSTGLFRRISCLMDLLFAGIPFCCGQFIILFFSVFLLIRIILLFIKSIRSSSPVFFIKSAVKGIFLWAGIVYFLFMTLWGFNYQHMPVSIKFPPAEEITGQELTSSLESLLQRISTSARQVNRKADGTFQADVTLLKEKFHGKPFLFSGLMSLAGISGFYCPFTGETVYNELMPDIYLPFAMAHEYAHKTGLALEDETNFAAYLTCICSDLPDLQYSGEITAFRYLLNDLAGTDPEAAKKIYKKLHPSAQADLKAGWNFWKAYHGRIRLISEKINDRFLKANGQSAGIDSYGKITGFLIALERKEFFKKKDSAEAESFKNFISEYK